jgi:hypothetical protein
LPHLGKKNPVQHVLWQRSVLPLECKD